MEDKVSELNEFIESLRSELRVGGGATLDELFDLALALRNEFHTLRSDHDTLRTECEQLRERVERLDYEDQLEITGGVPQKLDLPKLKKLAKSIREDMDGGARKTKI